MNIYLIGYRCTGKTTIGKMLSCELNKPFIDTDHELVRQQGQSIHEIVKTFGWERFRILEENIVKEACGIDNQVVATGGGVILLKSNTARMQDTGVLIWLKASAKTIINRIVADENTRDSRPPLTSKTLSEEVEKTLLKRTSLYESAMDFSVETDHVEQEHICSEITGYVEEKNNNVAIDG